MSDAPNEAREKYTLRDHQKALVDSINDSELPARLVVSWPNGSGKPVAFSAAAAALRDRVDDARILILAPAALLRQWADQLRHFAGIEAFVMTPQAYRLLQVETIKDANLWNTHSCVVVAVEFLKLKGRLSEVLATRWDLVIIDEVYPGISVSSQMNEVCWNIWEDKRLPMIAASCASDEVPEWLTVGPSTQLFVYTLEQAIRDGIVPQRKFSLVRYDPSKFENWIQGHLDEFFTNQDEPRNAVARAMLMRELESSFYAFEQSVRRLIAAEIAQAREPNSPDRFEELMFLIETRVDSRVGENIIATLENERIDPKWKACEDLLRRFGIGNSSSAIILTESVETAKYLDSLVSTRGWNSVLITPDLSERAGAIDRVRNEKGVLVTTPVGVVGGPIKFANEVIHYELPSGAPGLTRRCRQVESFGRGFEVFNHYFLVSKSADMESRYRGLMDELMSMNTLNSSS